MYMCSGRAQQPEENNSFGDSVCCIFLFCLVVFCAEVRKLHDASSHRCALRYEAMKNRVGFMTKKKFLHEQGPAIQYFLMN